MSSDDTRRLKRKHWQLCRPANSFTFTCTGNISLCTLITNHWKLFTAPSPNLHFGLNGGHFACSHASSTLCTWQERQTQLMYSHNCHLKTSCSRKGTLQRSTLITSQLMRFQKHSHLKRLPVWPRQIQYYLGSWLDPNLHMRHHITNMCKAGFFYLHNIRRIKETAYSPWYMHS